MLQNQLIDIQRFGLDSHFETINLTITGNTDMTGCRFMLNRQEYEYTGKTMTFKVREGQAYQLTYDSFPEHTAPSNLEPVVAEGGKVRNITADYVANGWGDYLVLDTTKDGITMVHLLMLLSKEIMRKQMIQLSDIKLNVMQVGSLIVLLGT